MSKKIHANGNIPISLEEKNNKKKKLENVFEEMLDILDFDRENDPNIKETPKRMAKMYIDELFSGCFSSDPKITTFPNTKKYDEMIISGPISVKSTCSHHLVPFTGSAYVAYIPDDKVIGLSKLSRIVKFFMRRPQIQEELTEQVVEYLQKLLSPKGIMVVIKAQHLCMTIRGVEEVNSWMFTSSVRGAFADNAETRKEFFDVCGIKGS